jgi:SAM-dependent methyltransferase
MLRRMGYLARTFGGRRQSFYPTDKFKAALRQSFCFYLHGDGIEIGALHQPLLVQGIPAITRIRYVDNFTVKQLREYYPELSDFKLVPVEIIDDGEKLAQIPEATLDFIIANHFIEHARSPLRTIKTWLHKLKPGGIIYMAIPDKNHIFDAARPLTTLEHLLADYRLDLPERTECDYQHYLEYAELVDRKSGPEIAQHAQKLIDTNYSIHFHTFSARSFLEVLQYAQKELAFPFDVVAFAGVVPGSDEFLVLLSRKGE